MLNFVVLEGEIPLALGFSYIHRMSMEILQKLCHCLEKLINLKKILPYSRVLVICIRDAQAFVKD